MFLAIFLQLSIGETFSKIKFGEKEDNYIPFYSSQFEKLEKGDQFLEKRNLPKLTQEGRANLNCSTTIQKCTTTQNLF